MVGNDIVDISEAKSRSDWQRPRYLDKLFTTQEQAYIHKSEDSFRTVWRLWTMKEAAYKLHTQLNPGRFYNPRAFECTIAGNSGQVVFNDHRYFVATRITSDYILSEARLESNNLISKVIVFETDDCQEQGEYLKAKALELVADAQDVPVEDLRLETSDYGIPKIIYNSKVISLSLTHHGHFGAFAIS
ncbi:MAG: 4-phosphopantetheinyl transferase family protein [Flavobacteriaceae bacterium]|nr:4-phosphopantetheinyl transferase family protein [Flavobacteriaceae bacterium]